MRRSTTTGKPLDPRRSHRGGDFELGGTDCGPDWSAVNAVLSYGAPRSGAHSCHVCVAGAGPGVDIALRASSRFPVGIPDRFRARAWVRLSGAGGAAPIAVVRVRQLGAAGVETTTSASMSRPLTTQFQELEVVASVAPGVSELALEVAGQLDSPLCMDVDDISLLIER